MKARFPGMDAYRKVWDEYGTRSAFAHGLISIYWDTGGLLNRTNGVPQDPDVVRIMVEACGQR